MSIRITKTLVDTYPIPSPQANGKPSQEFIRDASIPGFGLRITSGGAKSFIVERRIKGRVSRATLGKYGNITVAQARTMAMERLGEIAKGLDPDAEKVAADAQAVTVGEAFERYLLSRKDLKEGTVNNYRKCVDGCLADWKKKRLVDISKTMVETRHREIGEHAPGRANNVMRVLRAIFNHAMDAYEDAQGNPVIQTNPVARLSKAKAWYRLERRTGHIKPSELSRWHEGLAVLPHPVTKDYLLFLLFTGLRKNEAATLPWEHVNLADRTFTVMDTKNRDPHTLPLTPFLMKLLERRSADAKSDWVFKSPRNSGYIRDSRNAIKRVTEACGLSFTHHDLRRTFITIAESQDIPAYALKRLANHRIGNDITAGYIIADAERLRAPMEKVSDFLERNILDQPKTEY